MALKIGKPKKDASSGGKGGPVEVKGRFEILPDQPIPSMDSPPAFAFKAVATRRKDKERGFYAYICDPAMPPRLGIISLLTRLDDRHLIKVQDWDVVDWPLEGRRCPVMICEKPEGSRCFETVETTRRPMKEEELLRIVIDPLTAAIREMHAVGVFHGAIRADNVFFTSGQENEVMLGECYTSPANVAQPVAYSTISNALSHPTGRSPGSRADDMYALGVTLLAFVMGKNPVSQFPDDTELLRAKLTYGTYASMALSHRVSPAVMEVLRGLLNDNEDDRWGVEDLAMWVNGRRMNPRQHSMGQKASRPFMINGKEYDTAREVALGFSQNWDQAVGLIQEGNLDTWLRRSLSDDDRIEAVNIAKGVAAGNAVTQADQERLVSRILMSLSPVWPVQVREIACAFDGFAQMVAINIHNRDFTQFFVKVIDMGLVPFWLEMQERPNQDQLRVLQRLEKAKLLLVNRQMGNGLERVVYELNDYMPCSSVMFEDDYVPNLDYLLPALDRLARRRKWKLNALIDRNIAAYIAVNHKRNMNRYLQAMDSGHQAVENAVAQVRILMHLQETISKRGYVDLAMACVNFLQPYIDQFYSNDEQAAIRERMDKAAKNGRIKEIIAIVDDKEALQRDHAEFSKAVHEYTVVVVKQARLYEEIKDRHKIAGTIGGKISSGIAATLGVLGVCIASIFKLFL
ncbi:serine/threonine-protein kinase [Curvivirga aplysinae]|uniref:hypothetical protein n=1 Tax=Curvivirga aplysinae TaxID=2529852 RepID=UPI0012BB8107|nr:hypothetical protein [Curvivirga aplysinae]MTI09837.1 hypothetical protein [Curvivirga aplysinae]